MKLMKLILLLFVFSACEAQPQIRVASSPVKKTSYYSALSGRIKFTSTGIPNENLIPQLYVGYDIPAQANSALVVFIHGWSGQGGQSQFDPAAIPYLTSRGIGLISVGLRGRNSGSDESNVDADLTEYRNASGGSEIYSLYESIEYIKNFICAPGQIDPNKIVIYGSSGGGGNAIGFAAKFPEYASMIVDFQGMGKYGTYVDDPLSSLTSWYTDNVSFQGQIQQAVGGAPLSVTSPVNAQYLSRDHIRFISNFTGKFHIYHDTGDFFVSEGMSEALVTNLASNGQSYAFHKSTNGLYAHGSFDINFGIFDPVTPFGLQWVTDATSLSRVNLSNSGTLWVPGFVKTDNFEIWMMRYRTNFPATPRAAAASNQGNLFAASCTYNVTNETFQVTPIIPSTNAEQYCYVKIVKGSKTAIGLLNAVDVVTMVPKSLSKKPLNQAHSWKVFVDYSDSDCAVMDDQPKVCYANDLTGNTNIAFQQTRATRASITGGGLDNGVYYFTGTSGVLNTNAQSVTMAGAFSFVMSFDPDAATVASLNDFICGRGAGASSSIGWGTSSGKVQVQLKTETGTLISSQTPNNSNVGKQAWYFRRDGSNNVFVKCVNSTTTYDYGNIGTITGTFDLRVLGGASSTAKGFAGKIYKFAVADEDVGNTDATAIINDWFTN